MPWGLVNYEYKSPPRWAPPLALYSWPALSSDLAKCDESGFLERILQTLRLVWARRFPMPYLHFMNNNTQGRILYYF